MEIRDLTSKEELLLTFPIVQEMYPSLTKEAYSAELDIMLSNSYGQIAIFENGICIGLSGYWFGSKLWCGKYLECDNVIISASYRKKGIGKILFDELNKKAKELDCTMMALDSYTDNFKAHKFFYNQGFVPRGFHFIHVLQEEKLR
jgi:GNAT superfamily N-acetyltransferase